MAATYLPFQRLDLVLGCFCSLDQLQEETASIHITNTGCSFTAYCLLQVLILLLLFIFFHTLGSALITNTKTLFHAVVSEHQNHSECVTLQQLLAGAWVSAQRPTNESGPTGLQKEHHDDSDVTVTHLIDGLLASSHLPPQMGRLLFLLFQLRLQLTDFIPQEAIVCPAATISALGVLRTDQKKR